ncbi:tRNA (adenosine(37)-N6)-dimethylallyltransferase MiaA [Terasakiella sp. A23]|uniref:tRNA (adenosine(37)-N6)-dimethylallyltransferase MiaA n=1 Tax=Terasakiella sp. FCG-A23 TaxID=3080561 RepID=UPI002955C22F|nr:tRNA (adenosine(37)-N6)-dimethylallyltransferase MiaA [Terasakiella sp. A23]MDV7337960.1 tRNA (adenosine(37)-N6)-dimethylallyltransferase MiaA [Terasakiella sp. A23]
MQTKAKKPVIVIGGPTASGKSATALDIAREFDGVIINADSMQIYDGLRVVTARPSVEDEALAPHRLYGVMDPSETCSAGYWEKLCVAEIENVWAEGKLPVVTGGTGLYIKTLVEGISQLPPIPEEIRTQIRRRADEDGIEVLYAELQAKDSEMAARLKPRDAQRICRALEVLEATGTSLAVLQREIKPEPALDAAFMTDVIMPPRDILYKRCDMRFDLMLEEGAIEEVTALDKLKLDGKLPIMKALGVPELLSYVRGEATLEEARDLAQMQTRRFAKRQCTWFRNQIKQCEIHSAQYSESLRDEIYKKIRQFLLTYSL